VPCSFFLEYHNDERRIRVGTRIDNTHHKKFLNNFINFIFLGKWVTIMANIGRNTARDKGNGMIMGATGRGESLAVLKNILVFGEERMYANMYNR
jgi:hypothetical protein